MELQNLKTFMTIAKLGSFSKAAELLDYAQSSVSAQIKALENELGTRLFERLGREIYLTEEGKRLMVYAEQLLRLEEETRESISGNTIPKGTLTIGAPESLSIYRLPALLQEYRKRYPQVKLILKLGSCHDIRGWIRKNIVDLGFIIDTPSTENDLVVHCLTRETMTLFSGINHPLTQKTLLLAEDLAGEDLILVEEDACCYRMIFETQLTSAGVQPSSIQEFGSVETIKKCVSSGLGISILPQIAVEDEINQGLLKRLAWQNFDFNIFTQMLYRKDKWLSPALTVMIGLVKETFQVNQ